MTILQTDLNDSVKKKLQLYYLVNTPTVSYSTVEFVKQRDKAMTWFLRIRIKY